MQCHKADCTANAFIGLPACQHCSQRFCMGHRLPEQHGCGTSAQLQGRINAQEDARQVKHDKKEHDVQDLKAKLHQKRADLAGQRQKKGGGGDGGKRRK